MVEAVLFAWGHTLATWAPDDEPREETRRLGSTTHAMLEALRKRGLKLGLVSNAPDPPEGLHRELADTGIAARIDYAVFATEAGRRKPDREIFERALEALGVRAESALFVGDRLDEDVRGAAEVGMTTVQALWFRADDHPDGVEADYLAFTQMDVLNVVRRLNGE
ncbi:MAG: putative hydrolase of the superfamily [Gaiellaceae bacterium]|nr:putative hydrolase of the superfamily [Gaiellaceae bacterium]